MVKSREPKIDYRKLILTTVGVVGVVSLAVLAPNALQVLPMFGIGQRKKHDKRYYLNKTVGRLEQQGLVKLAKNKNGILCVHLTPLGVSQLEKYELSKLKIEKPKKWDRKYRVVIFDIKEWKRWTRDGLRGWLSHLGFVRLQNSVWVYPYECEDILVLLKSNFKIGKEVLYMTVDSIENDYWLRKEFGLV